MGKWRGLFGLAMVGFAMPTFAGECDKIRSSYAEAVCHTPEIAANNALMETAYEQLLGQLSTENQRILSKGQRSWLDFSRIACTQNGILQTEPYVDYALECVGDVLAARQRWFERQWMVDGFQTYPVDSFLAVADPNGGGVGPPVGSFAFSFVLLNADSELALAFNAYARSGYGDGTLSPENDLTNYTGDVDIETQISIYEITPHRISSMVETYAYSHGAAHGGSSISYEHFLVTEQRPLVAGDIFSGSNWQQKLIAATDAAIQNNPELAENIWEDISDVVPFVVELERWKFTPEGLEIQFLPYELAAFAYGLPSVVVSWDDLADILTPGALEIALVE